MSGEQLRAAVGGLMGRAKDDLTEFVSFASVADPEQFPPEECEKAAQWEAKTHQWDPKAPTTASVLATLTPSKPKGR